VAVEVVGHVEALRPAVARDDRVTALELVVAVVAGRLDGDPASSDAMMSMKACATSVPDASSTFRSVGSEGANSYLYRLDQKSAFVTLRRLSIDDIWVFFPAAKRPVTSRLGVGHARPYLGKPHYRPGDAARGSRLSAHDKIPRTTGTPSPLPPWHGPGSSIAVAIAQRASGFVNNRVVRGELKSPESKSEGS